MSYNNTLNLPKTSFKMKASLPSREPGFQKLWQDMDVYRKVLEKNSAGEVFILHDGPPYANGHIHLGHALNRVLKDILIKVKAMSGYRTPFVPGWDCHGLPVEFELMKTLGQQEVTDRVKFRKKAARYALKFVEIQKKEFRRLGLFGEWDNPYLTLNPSYEKRIIECFRDLYLAGYIYRELKPVYWCGSCSTALAEAEVEYGEIESPSIFVRFEMLSNPPSFIEGKGRVSALVWTTTPWTLLSNTGVCFHPDFEYSFLEKDGEFLIVASGFASGYEGWKEAGRVRGSFFEDAEFRAPFGERRSRAINADFVTLEDGTGIVHIAPGHGEDDYAAGRKYSLEILSLVDGKGRFTSDAAVEELAGMGVFEADPVITGILRERGLLFSEGMRPHSYPHCWRCRKPVIFRATKQWFLGVDKKDLRKRSLGLISDVKWHPEISEKRIRSMMESRPDWCLSRQRLWGVPVPVFYCRDCGEVLATRESFDRIAAMAEMEGTDAWFYRTAEEILEGVKCSCGSGALEKENDILDVWFDSGVSSFAVLEERESLEWPADMYLEGSDQHRGWFQTSLIPSVALKDRPPYRSVLTHGFTVDDEGKKMSKSEGNVISPQEIVEKYGADLLRLWAASENYFRDIKVSEEILSQLVTYYRRIRNSIRFILGNTSGFSGEEAVEYGEMTPIDRFILRRFHIMNRTVMENYNDCLFYRGTREIHEFCNNWLSSFYFNILKDRLYVSGRDSLKRRSSRTALRLMGESLLKLIAPVLSHTAEEGWQVMREESEPGLEESVFLAGFGEVPEEWEAPELEEEWMNIVRLREMVLKKIEEARGEGLVKDPLESRVAIGVSGKKALRFLTGISEVLSEYLIVSSAEVAPVEESEGPEFMDGSIDISVTRAEGMKCARCWLITPSGEVSDRYPDICGRCADVVGETE